MRYRRRHSEGSWFENHSLPFLSIMLGVISVMVLTNMLFAVRQKQDQEQKNAVQLIGVPKNYVPVYIRCGATKISWQEESEWVGIEFWEPLYRRLYAIFE